MSPLISASAFLASYYFLSRILGFGDYARLAEHPELLKKAMEEVEKLEREVVEPQDKERWGKAYRRTSVRAR